MPEAEDIFVQINGIDKKIDDLNDTMSRIERGTDVELQPGSVPQHLVCASRM